MTNQPPNTHTIELSKHIDLIDAVNLPRERATTLVELAMSRYSVPPDYLPYCRKAMADQFVAYLESVFYELTEIHQALGSGARANRENAMSKTNPKAISCLCDKTNPLDTLHHVKCVLSALQQADVGSEQMPDDDGAMGRFLMVQACADALDYVSDQVIKERKEGWPPHD